MYVRKTSVMLQLQVQSWALDFFVQQFHMNQLRKLRRARAENVRFLIFPLAPWSVPSSISSLQHLRFTAKANSFTTDNHPPPGTTGEPDRKPNIAYESHMGHYLPSATTVVLTTVHGESALFTGAAGAGLSRTDSSFASLLWLGVLARGPP